MGVTEMKTYVLEVDGEPKLVFRAPDDQQAENSWASPPYGWQGVWPYNPKKHLRNPHRYDPGDGSVEGT